MAHLVSYVESRTVELPIGRLPVRDFFRRPVGSLSAYRKSDFGPSFWKAIKSRVVALNPPRGYSALPKDKKLAWPTLPCVCARATVPGSSPVMAGCLATKHAVAPAPRPFAPDPRLRALGITHKKCVCPSPDCGALRHKKGSPLNVATRVQRHVPVLTNPLSKRVTELSAELAAVVKERDALRASAAGRLTALVRVSGLLSKSLGAQQRASNESRRLLNCLRTRKAESERKGKMLHASELTVATLRAATISVEAKAKVLVTEAVAQAEVPLRSTILSLQTELASRPSVTALAPVPSSPVVPPSVLAKDALLGRTVHANVAGTPAGDIDLNVMNVVSGVKTIVQLRKVVAKNYFDLKCGAPFSPAGAAVNDWRILIRCKLDGKVTASGTFPADFPVGLVGGLMFELF